MMWADLPEGFTIPSFEACCVVPWPSHPRDTVAAMQPLSLDHLATNPRPDPELAPEMTAANAARFEPYDDRLVAIADKAVDRLRGIWLPDKRNTGFEWTVYGTIVAVGPGARLRDGTRRPLDVNVGDRIVWSYRPSREEQTMREMFGERAILLRESDVLAVVEHEGQRAEADWTRARRGRGW